ncbi:FecR/PupR family sigma factor regulator [Pseudomonas frederiksbergensis]|nr:FecR/PupR family sigma factor regulator [Pseudomonas frederiksbergensis]
MKPTLPYEIDEEILTQAAHWCMRLQDDTCTLTERLAFQHWIQLDPRHPFEYAKMLEIRDAADQLPNNERTAGKLLVDPSQPQHGIRKIISGER